MNSREPLRIDNAALIQAGFRYALSLTHHTHDAEDLIQQACMKILRAKGTLVSKSYLFTTIRNQFIDAGRCRSESQAPEGSVESLAEEVTNHVLTVDRRLDMEQVLDCLRTEEREALFLNCVEGYTASEIAEITGQPRGTVLSHLSRARKRLQQARSMQDQVETR
ncbi:RNA polymerase sigma factor [Neorhodopirellula pilleata]|uniref:ECF RNA polymerase sigma factor SigR n=1 Tax=Neorhodopirellula pilleata TaxID=2714738 RepID=A0A5C5ZFW9_9BACT|nr:RNA polymerase sigma factor [Neorhodopirellula pilleata]TWT86222.1 ECF RNA polymerase sigma factor SigR [Neorhodopirellula pilleata]